MLTRPKASEPFQSARAITRAVQSRGPQRRPKAEGRRIKGWSRPKVLRLNPGPALGPWPLGLLLSLPQGALSVEPIVEVAAVLATAGEIAVVRGLGNFLVR